MGASSETPNMSERERPERDEVKGDEGATPKDDANE